MPNWSFMDIYRDWRGPLQFPLTIENGNVTVVTLNDATGIQSPCHITMLLEDRDTFYGWRLGAEERLVVAYPKDRWAWLDKEAIDDYYRKWWS